MSYTAHRPRRRGPWDRFASPMSLWAEARWTRS